MQLVTVAAVMRFPTYRADAGTVGQWVRGIARYERLAFRRREAPAGVRDAEAANLAGDDATAEEVVSRRLLLDRLLAGIPVRQQRAVVLVELWGLTVREAAVMEGVSPTRVHARYRGGMEALRKAALGMKEGAGRGSC